MQSTKRNVQPTWATITMGNRLLSIVNRWAQLSNLTATRVIVEVICCWAWVDNDDGDDDEELQEEEGEGTSNITNTLQSMPNGPAGNHIQRVRASICICIYQCVCVCTYDCLSVCVCLWAPQKWKQILAWLLIVCLFHCLVGVLGMSRRPIVGLVLPTHAHIYCFPIGNKNGGRKPLSQPGRRAQRSSGERAVEKLK